MFTSAFRASSTAAASEWPVQAATCSAAAPVEVLQQNGQEQGRERAKRREKKANLIIDGPQY